jgi:hypothetical protein
MEGSLGLNPAALNGTRMLFQTSDWSGRGDVTDVIVTRSADPPTTRDNGGPVPLPEFRDIAVPLAGCILVVVVLRKGRRVRPRKPSR